MADADSVDSFDYGIGDDDMRIKLVKPKAPTPEKRKKIRPVGYTDEGKPIFGFNAAGVPVCYRRLPKKDNGNGRCMSTACMTNGRCSTHGGRAARGAALPQYKDGTYSKYRTFPNGTAERIKEIISNPRYLSLSEDIAFYDLRIEEIGEQLAGLDKANVGKLLGLVDGLETALEKDDDKRIKQWLEKLIREVKRCLKKYDKHQELASVHKMRKELAEAEANITQKQDVQIPATRALAIFDRQAEIVIEEAERWIVDTAQRRNMLLAISERMNKLLPGAAVVHNPTQQQLSTEIRINETNGLVE